MLKALAFCVLSLFLLLCATGADELEASRTLDFKGESEASGVPAPWKLMTVSGKPQVKAKGPDDKDNRNAIWLKAESASFSLNQKIELNASQYRKIQVEWKAITLPTGGDVRKNGLFGNRNDQVLQVLVVFNGGRILSYIWDTTAPAGKEFDDSVIAGPRVKAIVIESGPQELGKWKTFERNLFSDFERAYGETPGKIEAIRVQTNSQHTGTVAEGYVREIVFSRHGTS